MKKKNRNKNQFYPTKGLDAEDLIYEEKIQKIEEKQNAKKREEIKAKNAYKFKTDEERFSIQNRERKIKALGTPTDERKFFTLDEKREILNKSSKLCACCGKSLTINDMTIEHFIPWSKGGSNELKNLLALCEDCNKDKKDNIYSAEYYTALMSYNNKAYIELRELFIEYFASIHDEFDVEKYPTISPKLNFLILPAVKQNKNKDKYKLHRKLVKTDMYKYSWSVLNYSKNDIENMKLKAFESDTQNTNWLDIFSINKTIINFLLSEHHADVNHPIQIIQCTHKNIPIMIGGIMYIKETKKLILSIQWAKSTLASNCITTLIYCFINAIAELYNTDIKFDIDNIHLYLSNTIYKKCPNMKISDYDLCDIITLPSGIVHLLFSKVITINKINDTTKVIKMHNI